MIDISTILSFDEEQLTAVVRGLVRRYLADSEGQPLVEDADGLLRLPGEQSPPPPPPPPVAAAPFNHYQEYFGNGGPAAAQQSADLLIPSAAFRAGLSPEETSYFDFHHGIVLVTILPHDLISPAAEAFLQNWYPDSTDPNYRTTMAALARTYGFDNVFMFAGPEFNNDPANQGWATNRFLEAGVLATSGRPDIPTGLTRQQAYDQWMHFYLDDHHDGITNHHQLGRLLRQSAAARGFKMACNSTQQGSSHMDFEMGWDLMTIQHNIDQLAGIVGGIGMIRGAARQYNRQWGVDLSHSKGDHELTYNGSTLTQGWSTATYRRTRFLSCMAGADVLAEEAITWSGTATTINGHGYNPGAVELRNFRDFVNRHPDRGFPHVPVAIMKDHISKLEPRGGPYGQNRGVWFSQMSPNGGELMVFNLLDTVWPGYNLWGTGPTTPGAPEPMGSGRWGEQFDFLTERATPAVMAQYKAIILATNAPMDAALQAALTVYVNGGGIVILNSKQLTGIAHQAITGITLAGTASASGAIVWELDASTTAEPAFNYTQVTLGTATRVAHSSTSTPQIVRNTVGAGEVWTVLPDWMSNPNNTATLGVAAKLVDYLIDRFAVARISGGSHNNIDYAVTTHAGANGTANVVTIINTNDPGGAAWTGTVSLPQGSPVEEWTQDGAVQFTANAGRINIAAAIPAGDVRTYRVG